MTEEISKLQNIIDDSENIVFFGGAGVSTESGIPDFRSVDGLYNETYKYPPEEIISHHFFLERPDEFYKFYKDRMIFLDAKPNAAHRKLSELERVGKLKAVVTQNIDGLHQKAGNECVYELHGSVLRNYCMKCGKFFPLEYVVREEGIPYCTYCNGMVKPDVVLYEEGLDNGTIEGAVAAIQEADTLIIAGTSLVVYPAAGLIHYFNGKHLVLINRDPTGADGLAELVIHDSVGKILDEIKV